MGHALIITQSPNLSEQSTIATVHRLRPHARRRHTPLATPNRLPTNHSWTLWTRAVLVANERTAGRLIANESSNCDYNEYMFQYNLSMDFNKNVNSKRQN